MKDLKIFTDNIESEAITQIYELLNQEAFKDAKVRIMPDVHAGKGCVIGFTADLGNKVIPNIVGVDIGCGMLICKLPSIFKEIDLKNIDDFINDNIPAGHEINKEIVTKNKKVLQDIKKLKCYNNLKNKDLFELSIGSLGGGNHFIGATRS